MQLKRAVDAVVAAFPRPAKLEQMLQYRLEKDLEALVAPGALTDRVFELFRVANAEGWDAQLVEAARASNPGSRELLALTQELGLEPPVAAPAREWVAASGGAIVDAGAWYRGLGLALARVGRVELDGRASGTGFLVGPDLVLTCEHVIAPPHGELTVRFDHRTEGGQTVAPGVVVKVVAVVDRSPPSPHDLERRPAAEPAADQLDHALLRLERAIGDEPIGAQAEPGAPPRGWLTLARSGFVAGAPLAIVQHPRGRPVALAVEPHAICGVNAGGTRVRYRTRTEPGSSGSPCFDTAWNVIAVHH
ncbi:MAG TPA: trypsin-like peptidase domain-containing protein, partial [Kofleriaceae bacterium]|nr:trypsin-like peptidase domain-containing protein [Kofleriaceae bacterium]